MVFVNKGALEMKVAFLAVVAAVAGVLVSDAGAARSASPCDHVSRVAIESSLGITVSSSRTVPSPGAIGLTVCFFGTKTNPIAVSIGLQTASGKKTYGVDLEQTGHLAKTVSGVGDKAFYNTSFPGGSTSLQVLKGNVLISFVSPSSLAKVETLAKKIVATF